MRLTLEMTTCAARDGLAALITGDSGTGKTALARAIHHNSERVDPFAMVNCGAMSDTLVESELFGAERGSHSAADERRIGKVEAAHGGTLFLDEIADLSMPAQANLLTLLQSRELYRLGGLEPIRVDFRLVCATNVDLRARVADGRFRLDLLHRIDGFPIRMPGLDERREDVPVLAEHVLSCFAEQCRRDALRLDASAAIALIARPWPGHVRELENMVRRGAVAAWMAGARTLDASHLEGEDDGQDFCFAPAGRHGFQTSGAPGGPREDGVEHFGCRERARHRAVARLQPHP